MKNLKVSTYSLPKMEAKQKYQELLSLPNVTPLSKTKRRVYHALMRGQKIIDMYTAMEQAGFNELRQPRIAICRADAERCYFVPSTSWDGNKLLGDGGGIFSMESSDWRRMKHEPVRFPRATFTALVGQASREIPTLSTSVPQIPPEHYPKYALKNYYVLWEVDHWRTEPARDPILLRRLSKNLFVVLAEWDLSDLEWSIARGI